MPQGKQLLVGLLLMTTVGLPIYARAQTVFNAHTEDALTLPVVRNVTIIGTKGLKAVDVANVILSVSRGKTADATTLQAIANAVSTLYHQHGYSVASVIATDINDNGLLTVTVAEGTIRRIIIRGNTKTSSHVIRNAVDLQPGDAYREDRLRDARNRLSRLGIFDDVILVGALESEKESAKTKDVSANEGDITNPPSSHSENTEEKSPTVPDTQPTPDEPVTDEVGYVDLIIRVKEGRTGNVAATVGYNDGTGVLGFVDFTENNVYGTGHKASIQWQRTSTARFTSNGDFVPGRTRSAYLVSYDVPAIGPHSTAIGGEVYNTNTVFLPFFSNNQDNLRNYELRRGAKARVGRGVGHGNTLYLTARRDEVGYDPVPDSLNPPFDSLVDAQATIAAFGWNVVMDGRDDATNTRRGFLHTISYERAAPILGGSRNYVSVTGDFRAYVPLGPRVQNPILAVRFLGGAIGSNAPLSEQFWLGGYDLLRGYNLFSIRGTRMVFSSTELRVPFGNGFQGVLFTDIGNAYLPGDRVELSNLRGSGGVGLRFLTPIGPLRFDVAYGTHIQTYVSLGQSY